MHVSFMASFAIIAPDPATSRALYRDCMGLPLRQAGPDDDYVFTDELDGSKHFGVWPLAQVAQACFGSPVWPSDRPVPQASVEFDMPEPDAVGTAARELQASGYELLHDVRTEPWGQIIARIQSPEGVIVGVSYTPPMH